MLVEEGEDRGDGGEEGNREANCGGKVEGMWEVHGGINCGLEVEGM